MKTLDEVIKAFSEANKEVGCGDCQFNDAESDDIPCEMNDCFFNDALHYLKEYRSDKVMWEADRKSYQGFVDSYIKSRDKHQAAVIELKHKEKEVNEILTDYVALKQWWAEQQENLPLTWDELKTMEGKPVWIEGCGFSGFWVIIDYFSVGDEDFIALGGKCDEFWKQDMTDENNGTSWQAYRKERE